MKLAIKDIFILFTFLQLFVFAAFLLINKSRRKVGHVFLSVFFFCLSLNILNLFMLQHAHEFTGASVHFFYLGASFAFAYGPSFYLYAISLIHSPARFRFGILFHYIPFAVYLVFVILSFTLKSYGVKQELIAAGSLLSTVQYKLINATVHLQILVYLVFLFFDFKHYAVKMKELHSSMQKANYSWLISLLMGLLFLWCLDLVRYILIYISESLRMQVEAGLFICFTLFCYFLFYKAFTQPVLYSTALIQGSKKPSLSNLVREKHFGILQDHMEKKKAYLDPELNLFELSSQVAVPARSLSEVINRSTGQNFYDFVNTYRVRAAEQIFKEDIDQQKNILEVLYEVGFNSKSSFNTAFKKKTGLTPTQYRQNILESAFRKTGS